MLQIRPDFTKMASDKTFSYIDALDRTGLDPSSRRLLWDVIRDAKRTAAVVLTTHSMEEAEALCDRIGIFVGGKLSCIGNPQVSATHLTSKDA